MKNYSKRPFRKMTALLLLSLFFLFIFVGCEKNEETTALIGTPNLYTQLFLKEQETFHLMEEGESDINPYDEGKKGNFSLVLETEVPIFENSDQNFTFTEEGLLTVVMAVDKSKTSKELHSLEDLENSGLSVYFPLNPVEQKAVFASIAYGLEGENYTKEGALHYLKTLRKKGSFLSKEEEREEFAVYFCFDTEAVQMIEKGKNLEIVIPREGTLSYQFGLLGNRFLDGVSEEALLNHGFRLPTGESRNPHYPSVEKYKNVHKMEDLKRFHETTENLKSDLARKVEHSHYFSAVDVRERITFMTFSIFLILIWTATALHRSIRKRMRGWVWMICIETVGWLCLSIFKYMFRENSTVSRYCWYAYYIFLIGLVVTYLYISAVVDRMAEGSKPPKWFIPFVALYPVFLILVFTNDYHQLVFRYADFNTWNVNYTYGIAYHIIFIYSTICFLLSIAVLAMKSRQSPKRFSWIAPTCIAVLLLIFNMGYTRDWSFFRDSSLAMVFCLFSVLFAESVLNAGLVPANRKYKELFSSAPFNMQLLNLEGKTVLASAGAENLTKKQIEKLCIKGEKNILKNENALLHSCKIDGGTAVWQENITKINELHRELQSSIDKMEKTNVLLQKEEEIQRKKVSAEVQAKLLSQLENDMAEKTGELSDIIKSLPRSKEKERDFSYIPLLLCHIKRCCNLFFISEEGRCASSNELAVYVDELSEFASYGDIHAVVRTGISGTVLVRKVALFYEFYFFLLKWAIRRSRATLVGRIVEKDGMMIFGILSSEKIVDLEFSADFEEGVREMNGEIYYRRVDDSEGIYLRFPIEKGEISND